MGGKNKPPQLCKPILTGVGNLSGFLGLPRSTVARRPALPYDGRRGEGGQGAGAKASRRWGERASRHRFVILGLARVIAAAQGLRGEFFATQSPENNPHLKHFKKHTESGILDGGEPHVFDCWQKT